jgi:hypothetical protein
VMKTNGHIKVEGSVLWLAVNRKVLCKSEDKFSPYSERNEGGEGAVASFSIVE